MKSRLFFAVAAFIISVGCHAQTTDGYFVGKNFVSFNDSLMKDADVSTFTVLSHRFAKDKSHVYKSGRILEFVDPKTFSVIDSKEENPSNNGKEVPDKQESAITEKTVDEDEDNNTLLDRLLGVDEVKNRYAIADGKVTYDGKPVKHADAATFKYVGGEYGADKHHAYYKGKVISDAWGVNQFKYKGSGTATDGVHYYSNGLPVDRD